MKFPVGFQKQHRQTEDDHPGYDEYYGKCIHMSGLHIDDACFFLCLPAEIFQTVRCDDRQVVHG